MIKITFVYTTFSSFIGNDYNIISKHFDVTKIKYNGIRDLVKIAKSVYKSDISYVWFAERKAFFVLLLSILFNKKSVVVAGGYDVACVPEISYGICNDGKIKRLITKCVLNWSNVVLPVSKRTKIECLKIMDRNDNIVLLYNGVDTTTFKPSGTKDDMVITVGSINKQSIYKKGFKTFVDTSKLLPNIKFILIGDHPDNTINYLRSINNDNISYPGRVSYDELIEYYQKTKVYVQVSKHESFGVSVAEAMACGCIPVTTENGALPEVSGNTGYYVCYDNPTATAEAITKALKETDHTKPVEHIQNNFTLEMRENKLVEIMEELYHLDN